MSSVTLNRGADESRRPEHRADRVEEILVTHLLGCGGQHSSVTLHPTAITLVSHLHHCTTAPPPVFSL